MVVTMRLPHQQQLLPGPASNPTHPQQQQQQQQDQQQPWRKQQCVPVAVMVVGVAMLTAPQWSMLSHQTPTHPKLMVTLQVQTPPTLQLQLHLLLLLLLLLQLLLHLLLLRPQKQRQHLLLPHLQ